MILPGFTPENGVTLRPAPDDFCALVEISFDKPASRSVAPLGKVESMSRFLALHRYEPFWMLPRTGASVAEIPIETQFLLIERADGSCLLIAPLHDSAGRASLQGNENGTLDLVFETGDPATVAIGCPTAALMAVGNDPYELILAASSCVAHVLGIPLRAEKPVPSFVDQFGWCTWDAFYQDVSHEKVVEGLQSFRDLGIEPRYLILDDGWQSVQTAAGGEKRLTAFDANEKFPGGLRETVSAAKDEFSIDTFLVWHAIGGYWGGIDPNALPGYGARNVARRSSPGILGYNDGPDKWWGPTVGSVPPDGLYRFYQDYHRALRLEGVDGVKVDNQASLESISEGIGGRIAHMRAAREALEGSVSVHFGPRGGRGGANLINCMSCSTEMLYQARASNLTRTSTDFWPNKPESHGLHLWTNAAVSLWFGQFVQPDWDMFQSGHDAGAYHAAGRALSGGPVYVSDKPGAHNADVLSRLVLPGGAIVRTDQPAIPARGNLFADPTKDDTLLKMVTTLADGSFGQVGVFNARYDAEKEIVLEGGFGPSDVFASYDDGFESEGDDEFGPRRYVAYRHATGECLVLAHDETAPISLPPLGWDVITISPIFEEITRIGFAGFFNGAGYLQIAGDHVLATLPGVALLHSFGKPAAVVTADGDETPLPFDYDESTGLLQVTLPGADEMEESYVCAFFVEFAELSGE